MGTTCPMTRIDSPASTSTLDRFAGDAEVFSDEYWGVRPLLRRAAAPGEFGELLDVEIIEELLAATLRSPAFRLVRDGATLPSRQYTRRVRIGVGDLKRCISLQIVKVGKPVGRI